MKMEDGVTLSATESGEPGRPAVILLHGGGQTRHSWRGTVKTLGELGYHALAFDARGHGESDWSAELNYSYNHLADDLEAVIGMVAAEPVLIGASMGGMTAMHTVGRSKGKLARALVLVDIAPRVDPRGLRRVHDFLNGYPDGFANIEEASDAVAAYNPHRPRPRDPRGLMKNLRLREDGRLYWHWDPRFFASRNDEQREKSTNRLLDMCPNIKIPTLLVHGAQSDVVSSSGIDELRARLPQLETALMPGAGHMIAGDRNDAFNSAILEFLDRLVPTGTSATRD
ncbi:MULTISPECIES: alpha/beta hydrolase [Burkholderiaceae]|uniref:alpha/beta fold hydrolase n=1 Tax=Burkholderiaceae TaxID=119060 RepID=UPI00141D9059|nr:MULTISPECIES: alpha/beta hydrolase [Burkholderiaceae]NIF55155.1 alpha/beta hydrolase [Burkholderia sp. Ax-1724]NIF80852.1 alpha/beta hydrolase [Paraburkholderia sp. Cy-641]